MRLIARLDIKNEYVIKGIHLEGLRKIGNPNELAIKYYSQGADEIVFMDAVASLYGRNNLFNIIEKACEDVFIPITIGGGIRSVNDIRCALNAGADKVAINTAAVKDPELISQASEMFGSQCIVGSIEAKRQSDSKWEAYVDNGRDRTGLDVIDWAKKLQKLGVGEILLTSIDNEGTKRGLDVDLIKNVNSVVSVPVIVCGGVGKPEHISSLWKKAKPGAVAVASIIHYEIFNLLEIKEHLRQNHVKGRQ
jgi:cyclase